MENARRHHVRPDRTARARSLRQDAPIPERILWSHLRANKLGGFKFRRQVPIGPFIADYVCREVFLVVELDGRSHEGRVEYDEQRTKAIERLGFTVIRFLNDDALKNIDDVLRTILRECESRRASS